MLLLPIAGAIISTMGATGVAGRSLNLFGNLREGRREQEELERQAAMQEYLLNRELDLREDRLRNDYTRTTTNINREAGGATSTIAATAGARGVRGGGSVNLQQERVGRLQDESLAQAAEDLQLGLEQIDIARIGGQYDIDLLNRQAEDAQANRRWQLGADITDFVGDFVGSVGRGLNMGVS